MRSQIAKKILMETPEDLKKLVRKRANDIIMINKKSDGKDVLYNWLGFSPDNYKR